MPYILCLYLLYYVPAAVQCHVMSCSRSEHRWWHWNIALHPSLILVMWMTIIVLLWKSGENVWNLQRWGISYSATWLFVGWWYWNTACSTTIFLESQVCHMCSGHLCDCASCPLSHFSGNHKHTRRTHMSGVTSLNCRNLGLCQGCSIKMTHPLDTGHLMASAKWVSVYVWWWRVIHFLQYVVPKVR
jgi:hypothetical protein